MSYGRPSVFDAGPATGGKTIRPKKSDEDEADLREMRGVYEERQRAGTWGNVKKEDPDFYSLVESLVKERKIEPVASPREKAPRPGGAKETAKADIVSPRRPFTPALPKQKPATPSSPAPLPNYGGYGTAGGQRPVAADEQANLPEEAAQAGRALAMSGPELPVALGVGALTPPPFNLITGPLAGYAAGELYRQKALPAILGPERAARLKAETEAGASRRPVGNFVGSALPAAATMRPSALLNPALWENMAAPAFRQAAGRAAGQATIGGVTALALQQAPTINALLANLVGLERPIPPLAPPDLPGAAGAAGLSAGFSGLPYWMRPPPKFQVIPREGGPLRQGATGLYQPPQDVEPPRPAARQIAGSTKQIEGPPPPRVRPVAPPSPPVARTNEGAIPMPGSPPVPKAVAEPAKKASVPSTPAADIESRLGDAARARSVGTFVGTTPSLSQATKKAHARPAPLVTQIAPSEETRRAKNVPPPPPTPRLIEPSYPALGAPEPGTPEGAIVAKGPVAPGYKAPGRRDFVPQPGPAPEKQPEEKKNAVQIGSPEEVLQREPVNAGSAGGGRGRVQPVVKGEKPAPKNEAESPPPAPAPQAPKPRKEKPAPAGGEKKAGVAAPKEKPAFAEKPHSEDVATQLAAIAAKTDVHADDLHSTYAVLAPRAGAKASIRYPQNAKGSRVKQAADALADAGLIERTNDPKGKEVVYSSKPLSSPPGDRAGVGVVSGPKLPPPALQIRPGGKVYPTSPPLPKSVPIPKEQQAAIEKVNRGEGERAGTGEDALVKKDDRETNDVAATSVRQIPAVHKAVAWTRGQTNVDLGGGKYDDATRYLRDTHGVENIVVDKYSRPETHNTAALARVRAIGGGDTGTIANVLNVVQEPAIRRQILSQAKTLVKPGGKIRISVYEGNGKGTGARTRKGTWQENRRLSTYLDEVKAVYPDAVVVGGKYIEATNPATTEKIGKDIGGATYLHRQYEARIPGVERAKKLLPSGFKYDVVKHNRATGAITFVGSPDFDTAHEPIVGDAYIVNTNGAVRHLPQARDPYVYHRKHEFVGRDYKGFDREAAIRRSADVDHLPGVDKRRIGRKSENDRQTLSLAEKYPSQRGMVGFGGKKPSSPPAPRTKAQERMDEKLAPPAPSPAAKLVQSLKPTPEFRTSNVAAAKRLFRSADAPVYEAAAVGMERRGIDTDELKFRSEGGLDPSERPDVLMRRSRQSAHNADTLIAHGVLDDEGKPLGPPATAMLSPLHDYAENAKVPKGKAREQIVDTAQKVMLAKRTVSRGKKIDADTNAKIADIEEAEKKRMAEDFDKAFNHSPARKKIDADIATKRDRVKIDTKRKIDRAEALLDRARGARDAATTQRERLAAQHQVVARTGDLARAEASRAKRIADIDAEEQGRLARLATEVDRRVKAASEKRKIDRMKTATGNAYEQQKKIIGVTEENEIETDPVIAKQYLADTQAADPELYKALEDSAANAHKFARSVLDYAHRYGRISTEAYDAAIKSEEYYIPLSQVDTEAQTNLIEGGEVVGKALGKVKQAIKTFRANAKKEQQIAQPIPELLDQAHRILRETERNRAVRALVDILDEPANLDIAKRIEPNHLPRTNGVVDRETLMRHGIVKVFRDGKPEYWQFSDEGPGIGKMKTSLARSVYALGEVYDAGVVGKASHIIKSFITTSIRFAQNQLFRDPQDRALTSRTVSNKPLGEVYDAGVVGKASHIIKSFITTSILEARRYLKPLTPAEKQELRRNSTGHTSTEYVSGAFDADRAFAEMMRRIGAEKKGPLYFIDKGLSAFSHAISVGEQANRKSEYRSAKDLALSKGLSPGEASLFAADQAIKLQDFTEKGVMGRVLDAYAGGFVSASFEGLSRNAARLNDVRKGRAGWKTYLGLALLGAVVPSVLANTKRWMDGSFEDYYDNPVYLRTSMHMIDQKEMPNTIVAFPKPHQAQALGAAIDAAFALSWSLGIKNKSRREAFQKRVIRSTVEAMGIALVPFDPESVLSSGVTGGVYQLSANKRVFSDRNIVPDSEKNLDLSQRVGRNDTPILSRKIGQAINVDSRLVKFGIETFFSNWGATALALSDALDPATRAKAMKWQDFLRKQTPFVRDVPGPFGTRVLEAEKAIEKLDRYYEGPGSEMKMDAIKNSKKEFFDLKRSYYDASTNAARAAAAKRLRSFAGEMHLPGSWLNTATRLPPPLPARRK